MKTDEELKNLNRVELFDELIDRLIEDEINNIEDVYMFLTKYCFTEKQVSSLIQERNICMFEALVHSPQLKVEHLEELLRCESSHSVRYLSQSSLFTTAHLDYLIKKDPRFYTDFMRHPSSTIYHFSLYMNYFTTPVEAIEILRNYSSNIPQKVIDFVNILKPECIHLLTKTTTVNNTSRE